VRAVLWFIYVLFLCEPPIKEGVAKINSARKALEKRARSGCALLFFAMRRPRGGIRVDKVQRVFKEGDVTESDHMLILVKRRRSFFERAFKS
jgi:hypothetical protein